MKATIVAAVTFAVVAGSAVAAAPASAVDDKTTCAAVEQTGTKMTDTLMGAGTMADTRNALVVAAAELSTAAAAADEGPLKSVLEKEAARLNQVASVPDYQLNDALSEYGSLPVGHEIDPLCGWGVMKTG